MDPDFFISAFGKYVEELTRVREIEVLTIPVTQQGAEVTLKYELQDDFNRIDGVAVNYLADYSDDKAGELIDFKIDNTSVFFNKGLGLDFLTARDHQNAEERFFKVTREVKRNDNIEIIIKDTSTGAFTPYVRKFYLQFSKPKN